MTTMHRVPQPLFPWHPCVPSELNAWPDGPRRLRCLRCRKRFESIHKGHRLCLPCRAEIASGSDERADW